MPNCWANGKMVEGMRQGASVLGHPACSVLSGKLSRAKPSTTGLATAAAQLRGSMTDKNP